MLDPFDPLRRDAERIHNLIGRRVREARLLAKVTQQELAERLRKQGFPVDQTAISRIEARIQDLTDREVAAIAQVLNIKIGWLFGEGRRPKPGRPPKGLRG